MGMLKKIVRGTSRKLLNKLAIAGNSRQQLVVNNVNANELNNDNDALEVADSGRELRGRYTHDARATGLSAGLASSSSYHRVTEHLSTSGRASSNKLDQRTSRQRIKAANKSGKHSKQQRAPIKHTSIPEAVLMAAKNRLPPVQFHHVHGPSAQLSKNNCVARRTQSFCQALVFSNRVIYPNERVYIKVLEIAKGWSGTIRFGFTSVDPATLRYQMPKHVCPDMTQMGHTWARALADEVVRRNSVIHFSYTTNGFIHYGINNQDCGIFYANVNTNQNLWFVVDVYGLTAAVELIDPRVHNASSTSELDLSLPQHCFNTLGETDADNNEDEADDVLDVDDDIVAAAMSMYKSTGALYQGGARSRRTSDNSRIALIQAAQRAAESLALRGRKRDASGHKQSSRNQQRSHQSQLAQYEQFLANSDSQSVAGRRIVSLNANPNNRLPFMSPSMSVAAAAVAAVNQSNQLPNLSSAMMPTAQQNIYSPMPGRGVVAEQPVNQPIQHQRANDTHDYYQISIGNTSNNSDIYQQYHQSSVEPSVTQENNVHSPSTSTRLNNRLPSTAFSESAICHQLEAVRLDSSADLNQQQVTTRHAKVTPIAAARKRLHQNGQSTSIANQSSLSSSSTTPTTTTTSTTTHKRSTTTDKAKSSLSQRQQRQQLLSDASAQQTPTNETKLANGCSSGAKSTSKSSRSLSKKGATINNGLSSKQQQSASSLSRDRNNNNSPMSKDCPICFERPINCVLYQCGHMCTCYECGVKQWRTQSRTCPICRTVIKDVIKTYMS